ncbi:MAG: hypothetical protein QNJ97_27405, partial [Myxococcota bacterium]|nr:hypothetical protein [Myxococcota bacterium]
SSLLLVIFFSDQYPLSWDTTPTSIPPLLPVLISQTLPVVLGGMRHGGSFLASLLTGVYSGMSDKITLVKQLAEERNIEQTLPQ